ncbi:glycosyltransferase family 2 protein [Streptomyces sp. NPDC059525]|uniref:glycosyltransferase family 2 protein n=1 Tax=Streptomyces sp. NPDC059525 TaxID=3346857 RepID=UPI003675A6C9
MASLLAQEEVDLDIVVIGNGCVPEQATEGVRTIDLPENVGIPEGRNIGAADAKEPEPGDLAEMVDCDLTSQYAPADLTTEGSALAAVGAFESDGFPFDTTGWMISELDYWFLYSCHALAWMVAQYDQLKTPVPV